MIRIRSEQKHLGKQTFSTSSIEGVEIKPVIYSEYYSVCLYKEPLYKQIRPKSDFKKRYLEPFQEEVQAHLEKHKMGLNIFCDAESVDLALSLKAGSVYVVKTPKQYPFFQHLYRYYSVFLEDRGVKTYHFRGMDNIVCSDEAMDKLKEFHGSNKDILHMPYLRYKTDQYCPIRGSCSVSNRGIESLRVFLRDNRFFPNVADNTLLWHSDEDFLAEWFNVAKNNLNIYTIIDRLMPMQYYVDLNNMIEKNVDFTIRRSLRGDI